MAFTSSEVAQAFQHDFDQMFVGKSGSDKTASPTTTVTYSGNCPFSNAYANSAAGYAGADRHCAFARACPV